MNYAKPKLLFVLIYNKTSNFCQSIYEIHIRTKRSLSLPKFQLSPSRPIRISEPHEFQALQTYILGLASKKQLQKYIAAAAAAGRRIELAHKKSQRVQDISPVSMSDTKPTGFYSPGVI